MGVSFGSNLLPNLMYYTNISLLLIGQSLRHQFGPFWCRFAFYLIRWRLKTWREVMLIKKQLSVRWNSFSNSTRCWKLTTHISRSVFNENIPVLTHHSHPTRQPLCLQVLLPWWSLCARTDISSMHMVGICTCMPIKFAYTNHSSYICSRQDKLRKNIPSYHVRTP